MIEFDQWAVGFACGIVATIVFLFSVEARRNRPHEGIGRPPGKPPGNPPKGPPPSIT